jgi:hypothetical protein
VLVEPLVVLAVVVELSEQSVEEVARGGGVPVSVLAAGDLFLLGDEPALGSNVDHELTGLGVLEQAAGAAGPVRRYGPGGCRRRSSIPIRASVAFARDASGLHGISTIGSRYRRIGPEDSNCSGLLAARVRRRPIRYGPP